MVLEVGLCNMGTVDIYHSRRVCYEECIYWVRDERNSRGPASDWILNHEPDGVFYAEETSPRYNQFNQSANVFGYDKDSITLKCDDEIDNIKRGCIVKYNGDIWIVQDVQAEPHKKESQFNKDKHYRFYINMRK